MSAIDLTRHRRMGHIFGYVPVYILECNSSWQAKRGEELSIENMGMKDDVCIGGGSGEHPCIIVRNISSAISDYENGFVCGDDKYDPKTKIIVCKDDEGFTLLQWKKRYKDRYSGFNFERYLVYSVGEISKFIRGERYFKSYINGIKIGIEEYRGNGIDELKVEKIK